MSDPIQQSSTTLPLPFFLVLTSDHITGAVDLTLADIVVEIQKEGSTAWTVPLGALEEHGYGWYHVLPNATDNNTVGFLKLHASGPGTDPTDPQFFVSPGNPLSLPTLNATQAFNNSGQTASLPAVVESYVTGQDPGSKVWSTALPGTFAAGSAGALVGDGFTPPSLGAVSATGFTISETDDIFTTNLDLTGWAITIQGGSTGVGQSALVGTYSTETGIGGLENNVWPAGTPTGSPIYYSVTSSIPQHLTIGTNLDKTGYALDSAGLDSIEVETGLNMRQAQSIVSALAAGILSGAGTGTIVIKGAGVSTVRITATTDSSGNRSALTLAPPE